MLNCKTVTNSPLPTQKHRGSWFYCPSNCPFTHLPTCTVDRGVTTTQPFYHEVIGNLPSCPHSAGVDSVLWDTAGNRSHPTLEWKIPQASLFSKKTAFIQEPAFPCEPTLSPVYKSSQAQSAHKAVQKSILSCVLPPLCLRINLNTKICGEGKRCLLTGYQIWGAWKNPCSKPTSSAKHRNSLVPRKTEIQTHAQFPIIPYWPFSALRSYTNRCPSSGSLPLSLSGICTLGF